MYFGTSINFLEWLSKRLIFRHGYLEYDDVIQKLKKCIDDITIIDIKISDDDLDKIISRYYADFYLEKTEDLNLGYTQTERKRLRQDIKSIVIDVITKNIPKEPIVKG